MKHLLPITFLLATTVTALAQPAAFGTVNAYSTGTDSYTQSIAVADVNGDGRPDVLTANYGTSTAGVLLGTGTGSFGTAMTYGTGNTSKPYAIAMADVNGDSKLDLLTANSNSSTAGVLLGTGTGSFGTATTYGTDSNGYVYGIAVADVNGDGKPDLLTANYGTNSVGVLLGTGTGSFGTATAFSTGPNSFPAGIAVADVNGDGKPDLLTANSDTNSVGVLLGTGTGSFGAVTAFNSGTSGRPVALTVADINSDGKADVLLANSTTGTVGVLLGTGTGSFGAVTTFNTEGSSPAGIAVADVNGDSKLDLLTANSGTNSVGVLLGTGTGSFGAATTFSTGTNSHPTGIAVADVNGDGKPDLLTANSGSSTAGVLLNTGNYMPLATTTSLSTPSAYLYPNPATHIAMLNGTVPGAQVQVYDALGRLVIAATTDAAGTAALRLPPWLAQGVYLVRVGTKALRLSVTD